MIVVDTNPIVYYLKDIKTAVDIFEHLRNLKEKLAISIITKIELLSYPNITQTEITKIDEFLKEFLVIYVDENVASICSYLRRKYRIKLPDALIAATSIYLDAELFTFNLRDFKKIKELKIYKY